MSLDFHTYNSTTNTFQFFSRNWDFCSSLNLKFIFSAQRLKVLYVVLGYTFYSEEMSKNKQTLFVLMTEQAE